MTELEWWGVKESAAHCNMTPAAWRSAVSAGRAPKPDDPDEGSPPERRRPRWRPETVKNWQSGRARAGIGGRPRKEPPMPLDLTSVVATAYACTTVGDTPTLDVIPGLDGSGDAPTLSLPIEADSCSADWDGLLARNGWTAVAVTAVGAVRQQGRRSDHSGDVLRRRIAAMFRERPGVTARALSVARGSDTASSVAQSRASVGRMW